MKTAFTQNRKRKGSDSLHYKQGDFILTCSERAKGDTWEDGDNTLSRTVTFFPASERLDVSRIVNDGDFNQFTMGEIKPLTVSNIKCIGRVFST